MYTRTTVADRKGGSDYTVDFLGREIIKLRI